MRNIIILACLACLAACAADKYSNVPEPRGAWSPANVNPESDDNNIVPEWAQVQPS